MTESQSVDGLAIVLVNLDDEDRREQMVHHFASLASEEINEALYEVHTGDWEDGLWDEELANFSELMFGDDTLTIW